MIEKDESKHFYNDIPRENSDFLLMDKYHDLQFDVKHEAAGIISFEDGNHIRLVFLGPIALFSKYTLSNSNGKKENIKHSQIACVMYKILKSSKGSDDL